MIQPPELANEEGRDRWETIRAAADGDTETLQGLLRRDLTLARAEFWYTPAIHFAVREGHPEAVRLLLDAGADPEWNGLHDGGLVEMAKERGHATIAALLERARDGRGRVTPEPADHPIHAAIRRGDVAAVRELLDADPRLVSLDSASGAAPLHLAVHGRDRGLVGLLLDRGADVHAARSAARGLGGGFWTDLQPIDLALWCRDRPPGDDAIPRLLLARGATHDLAVASALGDVDRVRQILDTDPGRIAETRPSGRRPLSAAIEHGHDDLARLLLERGADPGWPEPTAPRGRSLHVAAQAGNLAMVALLLAHGADPNGMVESSGSATFIASTPETRALLLAHGGTLEPFVDWTGDDEAAFRRAIENPDPLSLGETFTTACTLGKRDLLDRLLAAGVRVPAVVTSCQTYLLEHADMLRTLLAHGMSPDLANWQRQTLLHWLCARREGSDADLELAGILLRAGADLSARDDEYRSTPLAWAARAGSLPMVRLLLARGAPARLPDDEPWAAPLAWAERRGHAEIASLLREPRRP